MCPNRLSRRCRIFVSAPSGNSIVQSNTNLLSGRLVLHNGISAQMSRKPGSHRICEHRLGDAALGSHLPSFRQLHPCASSCSHPLDGARLAWIGRHASNRGSCESQNNLTGKRNAVGRSRGNELAQRRRRLSHARRCLWSRSAAACVSCIRA
jgi:hypothetical protein